MCSYFPVPQSCKCKSNFALGLYPSRLSRYKVLTSVPIYKAMMACH